MPLHSYHSHHPHLLHRMLNPQLVLTISLLVSLPIIFLIGPRILPSRRQHPISISDELDDLSLFNRALAAASPTHHSSSSFFRLGSTNPKLKIAFLFLTNTDLHFAPLWDRFFNTTDPDLFNIYVHADPRSNVRDPGSVFSGRFILSAKRTQRSSATLISAARRLIASAMLDDSANFYFALVSQTCVPLHSFNYFYAALFQTPSSSSFTWTRPFVKYRSFVEILANETTLPDRYNARGKGAMLPEIAFEDFRVGSQFFVLTKKHALMVLRDRKLWRKFKLPCFKISSCYPEEHYFPTLLSMRDPNGCSKFTLTNVNWTDSVDGHPHTYGPAEVSPRLIYDLRRSNFSVDYMFARKFSPDCLEPLMDIADDVILRD